MQHQPRTARNLAPLNHQKIDCWVVGCYFVQAFITLLLAILYSWLLGAFLYMAITALLGFLLCWAFHDDLCGFPFPGPRLTTQSNRSYQYEAPEIQLIRELARIFNSNSSNYGYYPVNAEDDSPPPYTVLPAPNNAAITDDALTTVPPTSLHE
ncbi:hypothetical protein F4825DRAFT_401225 [Nemania diffusa]|nr:hypothetical protein F4825DRAFT_401225 [Nemania diffusa]